MLLCQLVLRGLHMNIRPKLPLGGQGAHTSPLLGLLLPVASRRGAKMMHPRDSAEPWQSWADTPPSREARPGTMLPEAHNKQEGQVARPGSAMGQARS